MTKDGTNTIYNGRFGWVYEEEFGLVRAWGGIPIVSIAYWHIDESAVPIYQYSDLSGMHPDYKKIPYPRVGDPVPMAKIGIVEIKKARLPGLTFHWQGIFSTDLLDF